MTHVVLDTNVFAGDPRRNTAAFKSLAALCAKACVGIHLPEVVRREFEERLVRENSDALTKAVADFARKVGSFSGSHAPLPAPLLTTLRGAAGEGETWIRDEFAAWLAAHGAKILPVEGHHGARVLDGYFTGVPPYKEKKDRTSFPDAFILEAIRDLVAVQSDLHVVTADGTLAKACRDLGLSVHPDLETFVKGVDCAEMARPVNLLDGLQANEAKIRELANAPLTKELNGHSVAASYLPMDCDPLIGMFDVPEEIEFDWPNAEILPGGIAEVPFEFSMYANIEYFLYKYDYVGLREERSISVSEYDNDHYYEAEEEVEIRVTGSLSITVGPEVTEGNMDELERFLGDDSVDVSDIEEVEAI